MSDGTDAPKPRKWVAALLVILPAWLIASGGFAIWHYFRQEKVRAIEERQTFSRAVSADAIRDDLQKLVEVLGERHGATEAAGKNLTRASAMVEGSLGPSNIGLAVRKLEGPAQWPIVEASIPGTKPDSRPVWVVATLDSRPGTPGAEANASGVAAALAAAQALASAKPESAIHFAFLPHGNDPESPILETAQRLARQTGGNATILCVEAMGGGEDLWLSSRDADALPLAKASGLGVIRGADDVCLGDDADLTTVLFQMGLSAVRVSTRAAVAPDDPDQRQPDAAVVASSAGRLVELIRRCAVIR